jgi:hypothetical protein
MGRKENLWVPRNQKNFGYQTYVDDDGTSWNKRGETGGAAAAVDGHAAAVATQPVWEERPHNTVRKVIYQDATTGRTITPIIYTAAAYSEIAKGDVVAVAVAGLATAVNYTAIDKKPEHKRGTPTFTRQLADA